MAYKFLFKRNTFGSRRLAAFLLSFREESGQAMQEGVLSLAKKDLR